ncbi:MAG: hypothetical protein ACLGI2_05205 [Acidimicrobiia bacterium]
MGAGLAVEGERGPYVGSALVDVPTCDPGDEVGTVAARLSEGEAGMAVVTGDGIAVGWVDRERLAGAASPSVPVIDVMEPVPESLRPSVLLAQVDTRLAGRLVTTPEGRLLGALDRTNPFWGGESTPGVVETPQNGGS